MSAKLLPGLRSPGLSNAAAFGLALSLTGAYAQAGPVVTAGTAAPDTLGSLDPMEPQADPLLPDALSPGERMLWGPGGLMRRIGAYPLTEESREKELVLRRAMLNAHQVGGFLTLGSMLGTAYCGQMILNGESGYRGAKGILVTTTIAGYFTTALLSLLTPPPAIRRPGWNSVSTHKALAWVHFTGMIITPILGNLLEDDKDVQTLHQVSGYATTAAFAGAMFVITF